MNLPYSLIAHDFWDKNYFKFINSDEFESLGINPADIPAGTFAALKHPSQLLSRFGGNAYGLGLIEAYDRLDPNEIQLVQNVASKDVGIIKERHKEINKTYKKLGLLIRFSSNGEPYYLIPAHLTSLSLGHIKAKVDEISKIIGFHRVKYLKETYNVGVLLHQDDLILQELSLRFKEHNFVAVDSLEKLRSLKPTLDMFILTGGIYEIIFTEKFKISLQEKPSKRSLDKHANYILTRIYNLLKPEGEVFVVARHYMPRTNRTATVSFKTPQEEKSFALFSHIFKTRKRYRIKASSVQINLFDFQSYLNGIYVEPEIVDELLKGKQLENMRIEQIEALPYLDFPITDWPFLSDQEKVWTSLFSTYFDKMFLKPLIPDTLSREWKKRFSIDTYSPKYMMVYLGQKRGVKNVINKIKAEVDESSIAGCNVTFLADYKDSFEYVIETLRVLNKLKQGGGYKNAPQILIDRLKHPLESKERRFSGLNITVKLIKKINLLKKIKEYLNVSGKEDSRTSVLENLEILHLFGFNHAELKEIVYIVLGHTAMGRIIAGKKNERSLKEVVNLARNSDLKTALNLLRYCRLMTLAETEAARGSELAQGEIIQLFKLYELAVRLVITKNLDWEGLLFEDISSIGGFHNKIVRRILMMINHYEFIDNWTELRQKGDREKESLADYDEEKFFKIKNVIELVKSIETLSEMYLAPDPLRQSVFYRKFFETEFHGTGHLFNKMDAGNVFVLLWITVNIVRGGLINFNPIMSEIRSDEIENHLNKIQKEIAKINIATLGLGDLNKLSEQLYQEGNAFIAGTGFRLTVEPETKALAIDFMDIEKDIEKMKVLHNELSEHPISTIPVEHIKSFEDLFINLESLCKSHLNQAGQADIDMPLPVRQVKWFRKAVALRDSIRTNFLNVLFSSETFYTDLNLLYTKSPFFLNFVIPELGALKSLDFSWHIYMKSPVIHYILVTLNKLQALLTHDKDKFQDSDYMHRLAKREFGPMATGIVGLNEAQIRELEKTVERLSANQSLFGALLRAFIFQDVGRVPGLRKKYQDMMNPVDLGEAGSLFLEKEGIPQSYKLDKGGARHLVFLVRHHSLLHHIIRGEMSFSAIQAVLEPQDKDLLNAFLVFSFIMLSSIRGDLILEDLAQRIFMTKKVCDRIIAGEITLQEYQDNNYVKKGILHYALERFRTYGLPAGVTPVDYLRSQQGQEIDKSDVIQSGRMIVAMERVFRLRGIMYVSFSDLVHLMLKVPLKFIYKKRNFSSIGYATFEREVFEAFRIYHTLENLTEDTRHFILNKLTGDQVRLFGYEKVSGYLSYNNQIKLLLIALLGTETFGSESSPVLLNFLGLCQVIEKRYESVNDYLNELPAEEIWADKEFPDHLFSKQSGVVLKKETYPGVITIVFEDRINILEKISVMKGLNNVEELKSYYHEALLSLSRHLFYTEDYEQELSNAFEKKFREITDKILSQAKRQMDFIKDFRELHDWLTHFVDQGAEIGLSKDQRRRFFDLYELRKDTLKKEKIDEIESVLGAIDDINKLDDYWNSLKWYIKGNRRFFGKEFDLLLARKFDEAGARIKGLA
jgi:hypothetical protein